MPLISPEIQKVLRAAGLEKGSTAEPGSFTESLDKAGLDQQTIAEELFHLAKNSGNEAIRLRALESALKVHGALKETTAPPPSFTINILPAQGSTVQLPNALKELGVNPILVPRQVLNNLSQENKEN